MTISVDLNHRSKLWKYGKEPVEVMPELIKYCDVVMGNIWSAETLLGIPSTLPDSTGKTKEELIEAAGASMLKLHQRYAKAQAFGYTFRLDKEYFAVLQHGKEQAVSNIYTIGEVKDKVK